MPVLSKARGLAAAASVALTFGMLSAAPAITAHASTCHYEAQPDPPSSPLYVRTGPGKNYPTIQFDSYSYGDLVIASCSTTSGGGFAWRKTSNAPGGTQGWVNNDYLQPV